MWQDVQRLHRHARRDDDVRWNASCRRLTRGRPFEKVAERRKACVTCWLRRRWSRLIRRTPGGLLQVAFRRALVQHVSVLYMRTATLGAAANVGRRQLAKADNYMQGRLGVAAHHAVCCCPPSDSCLAPLALTARGAVERIYCYYSKGQKVIDQKNDRFEDWAAGWWPDPCGRGLAACQIGRNVRTGAARKGGVQNRATRLRGAAIVA